MPVIPACVFLAEIGAPDLRVGEHFGRLALGDLAAEIEHHDAVRDIHHHAHVMLDHQHRHAVFLVEIDDEAGHVLLLLEVHAGHRLVEQDQFGLERHRAGELDPLAKAIGQRAGGRLAHRLQVEKIDDLLDLAPMIQFLAPRAASASRATR